MDHDDATATEVGPEPGAPAPGRGDQGRLRGIRAIRPGSFDLRGTWQVLAGSLLFPLGLVIILFAWYGAAHTGFVQQQIPYLVSGSFIGLGCMVVGGLLYWAHWLYRIYDQADLHHAELLAALERLGQRGGVAPLGLEGLATAAVTTGTNGSNGHHLDADHLASGQLDGPGLVTTATGSLAHRPDCAVVARHPSGLRRLSASEARGAKRCRICNP